MISFKSGVNPGDLALLDRATWHLLSQCVLYCANYGQTLIITSLINDRDKIKSQSKTHEEGRAFDIDVDGFSPLHRARLVKKLNEIYANIGAVGSKTGRVVVALDEGDHIHVQVRRNAPIADLLEMF